MNYMSYGKLLLPVMIICSFAWAGESWAKSSYLSQVRAKYPEITGTALESCTLCHTDVPDLNGYGLAHKNNGKNSAALGKIEKPDQDADGDGVPNLVEILNLSMPGDASSKPQMPAANAVELISLWSSWKYLETGGAPAANWKDASFDDSAWPLDPAQLGYGNVGESTTLSYGGNSNQKYVTTYFRAVVTADPGMTYGNLKLNLLRNDGAIVYLNGTEILRTNMPGGSVNNSTPASGSGDAWITTPVDANLLTPGENIIAVEIHQESVSGANIGFNALLEATADQNNSAKHWMLWE